MGWHRAHSRTYLRGGEGRGGEGGSSQCIMPEPGVGPKGLPRGACRDLGGQQGVEEQGKETLGVPGPKGGGGRFCGAGHTAWVGTHGEACGSVAVTPGPGGLAGAPVCTVPGGPLDRGLAHSLPGAPLPPPPDSGHRSWTSAWPGRLTAR